MPGMTRTMTLMPFQRVASLDLRDLIEEEIVLSLPMAPRHPEDACSAQAEASAVGGSDSPFSALAGLKAH